METPAPTTNPIPPKVILGIGAAAIVLLFGAAKFVGYLKDRAEALSAQAHAENLIRLAQSPDQQETYRRFLESCPARLTEGAVQIKLSPLSKEGIVPTVGNERMCENMDLKADTPYRELNLNFCSKERLVGAQLFDLKVLGHDDLNGSLFVMQPQRAVSRRQVTPFILKPLLEAVRLGMQAEDLYARYVGVAAPRPQPTPSDRLSKDQLAAIINECVIEAWAGSQRPGGKPAYLRKETGPKAE